MEPAMNPDIIGAVKVPDGSVDPFRLCAANMVDAKLHGAQVLLYTEVTGVIKDGVCSPGGTTIRGVSALEKAAFRGAVIGALDAIEGGKDA